MAQHDLTFEAGVVTVLDQRAADDLIRKVGKLQKKISSGLSSKASEELSALSKQYIASQVMLGKAATTTSARIMLEKRANITSSFAKAAARQGADEAKIAIQAGNVSPYIPIPQTRIARMKPDLAEASVAYNELLSNYMAFEKEPTQEGKNVLLKSLTNIEALLANVSKDRKKNDKTITNISKDAKLIGKEVSGWQEATKPSRTVSAFGAADLLRTGGKWLKQILGIGSLIGGARKLVSMGLQGIQEGYNDLVEQSIYGANRNIGQTRALSRMYGIKEESVRGAETYALDFRQRMMMGEVSDQEFIALSRMGELGQMIVSGQGAKDPQRLHQAIQDYIRANKGNEAEVRQNLRFLGWNPDIMAYGAIEHETDREKMITGQYENLVAINKASALGTLIPSQILKTVEDEIKGVSGRGIKELFTGPESYKLLYRSMMSGSGFRPEEMDKIYADLYEKTGAYKSGKYSGVFMGANLMAPGFGEVLNTIYGARLNVENSIAESVKSTISLMPPATKEGVKEGVIEGFEEVLKSSTNRANLDRTIAGLANISSSNGGAY